MQTLLQGVKFGVGMEAKNPAFTILAVLTLELGIGAATTMFSVIEGAMLDPFPYADSHRLAVIVLRNTEWGIRGPSGARGDPSTFPSPVP